MGTFHVSPENFGKPFTWHAHWLIDMYLWTQGRGKVQPLSLEPRRVIRQSDEWRCSDHCKKSLEPLLVRYEQGDFNELFRYDEEEDEDDEYIQGYDKEKDDFLELFTRVFETAPWWVLRYIYTFGDEVELLEFTAHSRMADKALGCILAMEEDGELVYQLPLEIEPGSAQAQQHAEDWFRTNVWDFSPQRG